MRNIRRSTSHDYFESMGVPILADRAFTRADSIESTAVVVISKRMADDYFPDGDPVGEELFVWDQNFAVVGVADNIHECGLGEGFPRIFYMASGQVAPDRMQVLIRTAGNPLDLAARG